MVLPSLQSLGPRICILGPSNSGKSTLAAAIGAALGLDVIHLDTFYHLPGTDWCPRPRDEFMALHDREIMKERWVMDGNYSICMPQRLARATGVILLDVPTTTSLLRYFRRTLFQRDGRIGALEGGRDSIKWEMIHHIALTTPANRKRYAAMLEEMSRPVIALRSPAAIARFYQTENLTRPVRK